MKRKILSFILALFILPCCFLLSACNLFGLFNDIYYSDVPLDKVFNATMTHYLESTSGTGFLDKTTTLYAVAQKYETVAGTQYLVTYVEWKILMHFESGDHQYSEKFLHVTDGSYDGKTFIYNEQDDCWETEAQRNTRASLDTEDDIKTPFNNYGQAYLYINDSFSFRYKMTSNLWLRSALGPRQLPKKYITERTSEYIEYVCKDNEIFRVSNDKYNVLLKYYYDTGLGSLESQEATFNLNATTVPHLTNDNKTTGAHTDHVPYLNTITSAMMEA